MFTYRIFSYLLLLLLLPSLLIHPLGNLNVPIPESGQKKEYPSLTYDNVLQLLEEIESGSLERKCSPKQLSKINQFIALLAYEGMTLREASSVVALHEDVAHLLYDEELFCYASPSDKNTSFHFAQALSHDILCEKIQKCSWVSKKLQSTKKFVKKHRTAIIVGAVVVVAATVVIVAVSASSAAAATAAGVGVAVDTKPKAAPILQEKEDLRSLAQESVQEHLVQKVIQAKSSSIKEIVYEDVASNQDPLSLKEKGRELGAHLAHETLASVAEYLKIGYVKKNKI